MNKYINMILVSFFSFFLLRYDFALSLLVYMVMIYVKENNKNYLLIGIVSIISVIIQDITYIKILLVMYIFITVYLLLFQKKNSIIIDTIFVLVTTLSVNLLFLEENNIYLYLYTICGVILYIMTSILINTNKKVFSYFNVLTYLLATLGASITEYTVLDVNIGFILSVYFCISCAYSINTISSIVYGVLSICYFYFYMKIDYSILLLIVIICYIFDGILSSFLTVTILFVVGVIKDIYYNPILVIDIICILFELLKGKFIHKVNKRKEIELITQNKNEQVNKEVLAFASFLDMCCAKENGLKEYNKKLEDGINSLEYNYCEKCYIKDKCNKSLIREEFKDLILNGKDITYDIKNSFVLSVCPYNVEIRKSAIIVNNKIEAKEDKLKDDCIQTSLNAVSNILRQYVVDNSVKNELDNNIFYNIKKSITLANLMIVYFNIVKPYKDDYLIELGIKESYSDLLKQKLENIITSILKESSVIYTEEARGNSYFIITKKVLINIEYSKQSIASENINGDNLIVCETKDKVLRSVICDGMGKGYKANKQSKYVIEMLNSMFKTNISTFTIVQILNTFCELKDNIDTYTTLDFLEIDMKKSEGVFYKMSGATSYVFKHNNEIIKIENKRLPLGKESEILTENIKLEPKDVIVMSSDGIFDNIKNEKDIELYIQSLTHLSPGKIAYQILDYLKKDKIYNNDDMTIVVLKILPM